MTRRSLLWPAPRVKPPYGSAAIDWGHPLAWGLDLCALMNEGAGAIQDLTRRRLAPTMTDMARASSAVGPVLDFNGTSAQVVYGSSWVPVLPITLAFRVFVREADVTGLFDSGPSTANTLRNSAGGAAKIEWWNADPSVLIAELTLNTWTDLVAVFSFTTVRTVEIYLDGRLVQSGTGGASSTISWTTFTLGSINGGGGGWFDGQLSHFLVWSGRRLLAQDVAELYAEPYAFLRPILRRRYFVPAAPPITGTLSATLAPMTAAATGTVAVTGSTTATLGALTLASTGTVTAGGTGVLSATLAPLTLLATGEVAVEGVAAITLAPMTLAATGTLGAVPIPFTPILTADEIMLIAYRRTDRDPGWMAPRPPRPIEDHVPKLAGPDPGPWPYPVEDEVYA